ncbi:MAG: hydroxyacylglutathione hydrolase [Chlamydiia bacterium]|nr:hydroxyacylglutathione hydrolase [Chlamydiia bacterium]
MSGVNTKDLGEGRTLYQLKILEDNFTYILSWGEDALVIDPGDGKKVLQFFSENHLRLKDILVTHYHEDHTGGIPFLVENGGCHVIGPDDERVPKLEQSVDDGEELIIGPLTIEILATPGHTKPHIIYFFRELRLLFTGDLLFGGGCGRLFEGSPEEMWHSLEKVMALPDDTEIYCGHDYTLKNLEFALSIEPDNEAVKRRLESVKQLDTVGASSSLSVEKKTNPFLRAKDPLLQKALGMTSADPIAVFAKIRELKDKSA